MARKGVKRPEVQVDLEEALALARMAKKSRTKNKIIVGKPN